jgi:hypothetical protein
MNKAHVHVYESVDDMVQAADQAYQSGKMYSGAQAPDPYTTGRRLEDWADIKAKVGAVWPEGIEIVDDMLTELRGAELPKPSSRIRRFRWNEDDGDELDNDRLRSGQPCWRNAHREQHTGSQTISIFVNIAARYNVRADQILWRGATAIALANLLEGAGYRVEFWAVRYSERGYVDGADTFQVAKLKRADQPLDSATLVNGVSGWFLRTVVYQDMYSEQKSAPSDGLGRASYLSEHDERLVDLVAGNQAIVIDGVWERAAALAKVREVIEGLNK